MNCTRPLGGSLRSFANLIYTYLPELLWWLGGPAAWALQAYRLMLFVVLLLPGFLPHAFRYFFTSPHVWASSYGDSVRHRLDVYLPLGPNGEPLAAKEGAAVPIVVFVTGGAWIIGYRMWGFLLGFALQKHGVICICVDYRNFPQARIPQMIDDVSDALDWVYEHASSLGGSPDDISLVGQSAGAHLSAMVVLRLMRQRKDASSRPPLRRFVGISGPYDMPKIKPSLSKRGLHPGLIDALACGRLEEVSPSLLLPASATRRPTPSSIVGDVEHGEKAPTAVAFAPTAEAFATTAATDFAPTAATAFAPTAATASAPSAASADDVDGSRSRRRRASSDGASSPAGADGARPRHRRASSDASMALLRTLGAAADASSWKADWPPIVLLHGTADQTVPWEQSHDFAMRLRACGAYSVTERYYENKSHTDPIVEDPLCGGDVLLADLLDMVLGPADRTAELKVGLWPSMLPAPRWLFPLAKRINPF